ncbi:nuclear GTPase SLIP-GC-like isoform X2 [Notolabrus celidotus]|uniref:nuclear GTPase SLIP-GC-like isoform X2 n=1 Tax=Notolabrus celidotus TaxID=1203425 RepID=UPI00148FD111|nr:nuclear GTPase SLIP-GC-like isoform X2 [Notolabrus celidotus]
MTCVQSKLNQGDNAELNDFLKTKIHDLKKEKREMIGVFGRTGAGKSSLINAVIGEKDLLPSGDVSACTSVMIKVEANTKNKNYEAEIEFISEEEWKHDLWYLSKFVLNKAEDEEDAREEHDDNDDAVEMLSALYGEDWEKNSSPESLCHDKHFREIPEFKNSENKTLTCESARELSTELVKYTRSGSKEGKGKEAKRWFWPLVKCVTVRVPKNDLLQHVTLVDLPGSGDRNKSRDKMWKGVIGDCSTVWIVAEIKRAAAEEEPWEILKNANSNMGNGGQCQQIHFICTMSDVLGNVKNRSAEDVRANIFKRNMQAKDAVKKEFRKLNKTHIREECFEVFTVSSTEFLGKEWLEPDETEIPKLKEFLRNLNDRHSGTLNYQYVSEAKGILSLIQGARQGDVAGKRADVCGVLREKMGRGHENVLESMQNTYEAFENCLMEGVENSRSSCTSAVKYFLKPIGIKGGAFHRTLKCVVANNGAYKPKNKKKLDLNAKLSSWLAESIDEEFRKTFPNESKCESFNGSISSFSLDTESLVESNNEVQLHLEFLRTEEEKMKTNLWDRIQKRKKEIYNSLTISIEETMQQCYDEAKHCKGSGSLAMMRTIIETHEEIPKTLNETMLKSINLSLKTDCQSLPDVEEELEAVTKYFEQLKRSTNEETSAVVMTNPARQLHSSEEKQ